MSLEGAAGICTSCCGKTGLCPLKWGPKVRCPYCKQDNDRVIDSRSSADGYSIRRRRECLDCGRRFTTYERMEETPLRVVKKMANHQEKDKG